MININKEVNSIIRRCEKTPNPLSAVQKKIAQLMTEDYDRNKARIEALLNYSYDLRGM